MSKKILDPVAKLVPTAEFSTTRKIKVIPKAEGFSSYLAAKSEGLPMPQIDEKKSIYGNVNPDWKRTGLGTILSWQLSKKDPQPATFPSPKEAAIRLPTASTIDWHALHRFSPNGCRCDKCAAGGATEDPYANQLAVTWCGHSAFVVTVGGYSVLTDPVWSRASPVQFAGPARMVPSAVAMEDLPYIDVVTISHNHYDHLDTAAVTNLIRFNHGYKSSGTSSASCSSGASAKVDDVFTHPVFVVPIGMKTRWFVPLKKSVPELDLDLVVELMWWDTADVAAAVAGNRAKKQLTPAELPPFTVAAVPVQHWATRVWTDFNKELWCGYDITIGKKEAEASPPYKLFHCGDTGYYAPIFKIIGDACGPFDLAMLPIGAYEPRYVFSEQHNDPFEAVQIHQDIKAKHSVGMHWGTFILTAEAIDEPPKALAVAMAVADEAVESLIAQEINSIVEADGAPNAIKLKQLRKSDFYHSDPSKLPLKAIGDGISSSDFVIPYYECKKPFRALKHGESWMIDIIDAGEL